MSLNMTRAELEAFLADLHVGVISIEVADAAPLSAPIWYDYAPDAGLWVLTSPGSLKGKALAAAGANSAAAISAMRDSLVTCFPVSGPSSSPQSAR